jgi:hypothetical protein
MENIIIGLTERTPEVSFDFASGKLSMRGESYPEDAASFFGPLYQGLKAYLTSIEGVSVSFDMHMIYFNSSSAKAIMRLFQLLEEAGGTGNDIQVNWHYSPDDDTMQEFGEDFAEDFSKAKFNLCPEEA